MRGDSKDQGGTEGRKDEIRQAVDLEYRGTQEELIVLVLGGYGILLSVRLSDK